VPVHLHLALLLRQCGLYTLALTAYRDAIDADPGCFDAWFALGEVLLRRRHWRGAVEAFRAAAALRPADVETQGHLVLALYRSHRRREAAEAMRRLVDIRPGEPELHVGLGMIQCRAGRPGEAIRTFRWAARLADPPAAKRFALGEALFGDRSWVEALADLETARRTVGAPRSACGHGRAAFRPHSRWAAPAAILHARLRSPAALSAGFSRLVASGHMLVAYGLRRTHPYLAIRSLRAAQRRSALAGSL
jgi:tetratricopeptide (TPR) repeat protein